MEPTSCQPAHLPSTLPWVSASRRGPRLVLPESHRIKQRSPQPEGLQVPREPGRRPIPPHQPWHLFWLFLRRPQHGPWAPEQGPSQAGLHCSPSPSPRDLALHCLPFPFSLPSLLCGTSLLLICPHIFISYLLLPLGFSFWFFFVCFFFVLFCFFCFLLFSTLSRLPGSSSSFSSSSCCRW